MQHSIPGPLKPFQRVPLTACIIIALLCILALCWQLLPLDTWFADDHLSGIAQRLGNDPLAPLIVVVLYTLAGLLAFPVIILIPATAMIFGPLSGLLYSLCGLVANASVLYAIGHFLGRETLNRYAGNRAQQISQSLTRHGFMTVTLLRLLPVAPFFLINIISGASPITFRTYTFATVTGISPALIVMTIAGTQLRSTLDNPVPGQLIVCAITVAALLLAGRWISRKARARAFR